MTSHLFVLEPNYLACRPVGITPAPLGSILVASLSGEGELVVAVEAVARATEEPWCPVVLVTRAPRLSNSVQAVVEQFPMAPAVLSLPGQADLLSPDRIVAAVRAEPKPAPGTLAGYVAARTGRPDLREVLEDCFRRGSPEDGGFESRSRSTLSRRLSDFGPLKPRDWTGLARALTLLLATGSLRSLCEKFSIDPRTVQAHIQRFTGLEFVEAREHAGWQWVIESGLRREGYIDDHTPPGTVWRIDRSG